MEVNEELNGATTQPTEFTIRLDWTTLDREELREYINNLHNYLMDFKTSSIHDLILELDNVARVITSDLVLIAQGKGIKAKFLTESKEDKQYERVIQLIKMAKDFKEMSNMASELRPKVTEENRQAVLESVGIKIVPSVPMEVGANVFEHAQGLIVKKKGSK